MATATMEETLAAMEGTGWRLQHLSLSGSAAPKYSCILERRAVRGGEHGDLYASSPLCPSAPEALAAAWRAAQGKGRSPPVWLPRLKLALAAAHAALATGGGGNGIT